MEGSTVGRGVKGSQGDGAQGRSGPPQGGGVAGTSSDVLKPSSESKRQQCRFSENASESQCDQGRYASEEKGKPARLHTAVVLRGPTHLLRKSLE